MDNFVPLNKYINSAIIPIFRKYGHGKGAWNAPYVIKTKEKKAPALKLLCPAPHCPGQ